jgi:uncharacterized protein (TIGR02391 family)
MARRKQEAELSIQPREFRSVDEINRAIAKLERRIRELGGLNVLDAVLNDSAADDTAIHNLRSTILEIYGESSPEYQRHRYIRMWAGPMFVNMSTDQVIEGTERGRTQTIGIIKGLIASLVEKRDEFTENSSLSPMARFSKLQLHPRIEGVARQRFLDGHHWDAVFAASKTLINMVKEAAGEYELDGAPLVRKVFSKNSPILAVNDLADRTDQDEQEGIMHLFEGAVMAVRNPGGHSFPAGTEQRALEYISLLSMLAYIVQEAKKP